MATWTRLGSTQYNLNASEDRYIGQLYYDYRLKRWKIYLQCCNRTGWFNIPEDQSEQAKLATSQWVLDVLNEETKWMNETTEFLQSVIASGVVPDTTTNA